MRVLGVHVPKTEPRSHRSRCRGGLEAARRPRPEQSGQLAPMGAWAVHLRVHRRDWAPCVPLGWEPRVAAHLSWDRARTTWGGEAGRPGFPLRVDAGFGLRMCWLLSTGHLLRSQTPECRCPERARRGHVREKQPFTGRGRGDDPTGRHAEGAPRGGPPSFLPARLLHTVRGAGGRGVLSTPSQTLDSPARWLWGSPVPFGTK